MPDRTQVTGPRVVYKYPFSGTHEMSINAQDACVVHVGVDPSGDPSLPCMWIEHAVKGGGPSHTFGFYGTGHVIDRPNALHVGSVVTPVGLVWHVYEEVDS